MNGFLKIYLRANPPYWFDISPNIPNESPALVRLEFTSRLKPGLHTYNSKQLSEIGINTSKDGDYSTYCDEELIVVTSQKPPLLFRITGTPQLDLLKTLGNSIAQGFRSRTKSKLIHDLSQPSTKNPTDTVIAAFREYTYFDAYSVWLFNEMAESFTRIAGDVPPHRYFLKASQSAMLAGGLRADSTICRKISPNWEPPDALPADMTWVNIFPVAMTSSEAYPTFSVVVCMYSRNNQYDLRKETSDLIRSFLQQNLADRYFDRLIRLNNFRVQVGKNLRLDSPSDFLDTIVRSVAVELLWETCSIFLPDPENTSILRLAAIWPKPADLKRLSQQTYSLSKHSMTALVYKENAMMWSYDIANDPRNSHTFDDPTETTPRDWIGAPIATPGSRPIGVLRVKNRKMAHPDDVIHFSSFDMYNIQAIASETASILHQYHIFWERKQLADKRAVELRQLEDFLRTFRHEIRSPIQAVCFAPERIGLILRGEGLISRETMPKKLIEYLADFKATTNRLEMISKALTLNPDEIVQDFATHNVFKDCVAPVLAYSVPYANKKKRYIDVDKDSLLVNMMCDAVALSMAFHALLDNAIKYSDPRTTIKVYGERVESGHQIVVENESKIFWISDEDAKSITEKYYRGKLPRDQKLEGSGIGLYLARRIMELHQGALLILRQKSPVRFALRLRN